MSELLKYILLCADEKIEGSLINLNKLVEFGYSGNLAFRKYDVLFPLSQLFGIGSISHNYSEDVAFKYRYGSISVNLFSNSETFINQLQPLLNWGSKKHAISLIPQYTSIESFLEYLYNTVCFSLRFNDTKSSSLYDITVIHLFSDLGLCDKPLVIFDKFIKMILNNNLCFIPTPLSLSCTCSSFSSSSSSSSSSESSSSQHIYNLWISIIGHPYTVETAVPLNPLLKPSYTVSLNEDITDQITNKRIGYVHFCPGHTRIDRCLTFSEDSFKNGGGSTILAEQFFAEISCRLHCKPKYGA